MKLRIAFLSVVLFIFFLFALPFTGRCAPPEREYYEIRIYHLDNKAQEQKLDEYLKNALLPGLHHLGVNKVGVFKPKGNDTAATRSVYVLIPYKNFQQFESFSKKLDIDRTYLGLGAEFLNASYDKPPYQRIEKILTRAFVKMPVSEIPKLTGPKSERVYELRSYESTTEKLHENKVQMFNDGDEVGLFKRLGFNAVFYSQVIVGKSMPNLMYMTTFENMQSHDEHWKSFSADEQWKKLSAMPEYQHNVSHSDIYLLTPTEYSDL